MDKQAGYVVRNCMISLRFIYRCRPYLDLQSTKILVNFLILSRLDNLLAGHPGLITKNLQIVQNMAAKLVFKAGRREHATSLRKELHWLPTWTIRY